MNFLNKIEILEKSNKNKEVNEFKFSLTARETVKNYYALYNPYRLYIQDIANNLIYKDKDDKSKYVLLKTARISVKKQIFANELNLQNKYIKVYDYIDNDFLNNFFFNYVVNLTYDEYLDVTTSCTSCEFNPKKNNHYNIEKNKKFYLNGIDAEYLHNLTRYMKNKSSDKNNLKSKVACTIDLICLVYYLHFNNSLKYKKINVEQIK